MNESIEPNITTNSEQSCIQEESTEPNDIQTIDTILNQARNPLVQKRKPLLVADGTKDPDDPIEEISPEVIV